MARKCGHFAHLLGIFVRACLTVYDNCASLKILFVSTNVHRVTQRNAISDQHIGPNRTETDFSEFSDSFACSQPANRKAGSEPANGKTLAPALGQHLGQVAVMRQSLRFVCCLPPDCRSTGLMRIGRKNAHCNNEQAHFPARRQSPVPRPRFFCLFSPTFRIVLILIVWRFLF